MNSYPPLRLAVLTGLVDLKERLQSDPQFLESAECPYDNETKKVLRALLATQVVTKIEERIVEKRVNARGRPGKDIALSEEDQQKVKDEINSLVEALNVMGTGEGLETNERIQITKTKASLLNQLLQMLERVNNVKRMSEFQTTVIGILDDLIDEKGRETFLKRLEPYR